MGAPESPGSGALAPGRAEWGSWGTGGRPECRGGPVPGRGGVGGGARGGQARGGALGFHPAWEGEEETRRRGRGGGGARQPRAPSSHTQRGSTRREGGAGGSCSHCTGSRALPFLGGWALQSPAGRCPYPGPPPVSIPFPWVLVAHPGGSPAELVRTPNFASSPIAPSGSEPASPQPGLAARRRTATPARSAASGGRLLPRLPLRVLERTLRPLRGHRRSVTGTRRAHRTW